MGSVSFLLLAKYSYSLIIATEYKKTEVMTPAFARFSDTIMLL
ncbi:hypothetical protein DRA4_1936 [Lactococcus lactis subsp. lactis bv. diacetylactis]|nr:hypothetical protein NCDO895_1866 [Lactococcus lactis subsp. lactis]KZK10964.1 hypothetical protein DRA4_1936 [Lactococcus lactis subsp. lactis bv. diacetylactis]